MYPAHSQVYRRTRYTLGLFLKESSFCRASFYRFARGVRGRADVCLLIIARSVPLFVYVLRNDRTRVARSGYEAVFAALGSLVMMVAGS